MFDRNVSKILARYLEDVENGRTNVEECLRQHPEHADALRRHIELHQRVAGLPRLNPSSVAEQRGRQQLLTAVASQNIEGVPMLSSAIGKAIAGALASALLLTGAVSASAAMGGPNLPQQALSALGLDGNHDNGSSDAATPTATTTVTSHVEVTATPGPTEFIGLCNAWSQGSSNSQATNKRDAVAFQALIKAAKAENLTDTALEAKVSDFCATVVKPGQTPTQAGNRPTGTPGANSNSIDHPTGQPDVTLTPPVAHPAGQPDGTPTPPVDHPTGRSDGIPTPPVTH